MKKYEEHYCSKCHDWTMHKLVDKECYFEGFVRIFAAVATCGISEINNKTPVYQCLECNHIEKY